MFFYVSKIIWLFLQPSSLFVLVILAGALLLATKRALLGKRLVVWGSCLLLIFGFSPVANILILPLENRFPRVDLSTIKEPDGVIVLGGAVSTDIARSRHAPTFNAAGERMFELILLAQKYKNTKIVFSGGSAAILYEKIPESEGVKKYFWGPVENADRLLVESKSRNTYENAIFSKELLNPKPNETWLLVTSAYHMPRSVGCFRRAGFDVIPFVVDYRTSGWGYALRFFDQPSNGLRRADTAIREWVGLIAYWFTDKTSAFFPGPK